MCVCVYLRRASRVGVGVSELDQVGNHPGTMSSPGPPVAGVQEAPGGHRTGCMAPRPPPWREHRAGGAGSPTPGPGDGDKQMYLCLVRARGGGLELGETG